MEPAMSTRPIILSLCALALVSPSLSGCTDLKRALGMEKVVPDEFAVVQGAPLAMPPDFSLRPPKPGAPPSQEVSPTEQARQTIFRAGDQQAAAVPDADQLSPGENALLRQAGAANAPRDIRETVTRDAMQTPPPPDESFIDKLLFWRTPDKTANATDSVLDPAAEAQRLKAGGATAAGTGTPAAPVPELIGTPTIERRRDPSTTS
jgi:Protein of unknown function (DUF3035)